MSTFCAIPERFTGLSGIKDVSYLNTITNTVLLSELAGELQIWLYELTNYCKTWHEYTFPLNPLLFFLSFFFYLFSLNTPETNFILAQIFNQVLKMFVYLIDEMFRDLFTG